MSDNNPASLERFNTRITNPITAVFASLGTIFGVFIALGGFYINANSTKLANLQTTVNTELQQKEFNNSLKTDLLAQVKDAIKSQDTSVMRLTLLYINTLLTDSADSVFKEGLKTILLSTGGDKELLVTQSIIDTFKNLQSYMLRAKGKLNVNIFYLDDHQAEARESAENIKAALLRHYSDKFIVRIRNLPAYINAQSGYRIDANAIRYELADTLQANEVYQLIADSNLLPGNKPEMQQVTYHVPNNFISVFVRSK